MKHRGLFVMVLISLMVSSVFADNTSMIFNPVMDALSKILSYVVTVLASLIAIFLVPLAWFHVSKAIWTRGNVRDEKIYSNITSRQGARDRLKAHGIGEKELNLSSYRKAVEAEKFRKKFGTFEEWQGSSNYRRSRA
ncbi:hypothetical protein [Sulfurospirillum diekertiae]|uniref:Uncharacterized protein n=1 Tax=Sulfurospirillum diekertiae TaxID=1854492 RepID=A0A1Y0HPW1_9BACT|nr:hypothetical protein [Sulfurospirillum diekertiae]ARU49404.1 hypothetical protein Sdiek1_2252 [Sulfurospirillum diekertiae]ASC94211.1 hypothetical protein Sdiek2_2203 [Sulfurospirillum diekertiae]